MYVFLLFFAFTTNNIHENCEYSSISICNVKQRSSYDNTRSLYTTDCNKALRNWMKEGFMICNTITTIATIRFV